MTSTLARGLIAVVTGGLAAAYAAGVPARSAEAPTDAPTDARAGGGKVSVADGAESGDVTYRPPLRGAPTRRIGGSSRSTGKPTTRVVVFAPEDTGLTTAAQPTLYWYLSQPVDVPVEFVLVDPRETKPVIRTTLRTPMAAGIREVSLAAFGVRLATGVEYEWSIAVRLDPAQPSTSVVSTGGIRRIEPSGALRRRVADKDEHERYRVFAEEGVWYDAVDSVSREIRRRPAELHYAHTRNALLDQVGLTEYLPFAADR